MGREPARTFNDAIERWHREEVPRLKERTREQYIQNARHIAPFIEGRLLKDASSIAAEIRGAWPDLSPCTVNRRLSVVSRLCQLAFREWRWLDHPPRIRMLKEPKRENHLSQEQVEDIARECPRIGPLVLLAAHTGIRIGHLLRLKASDVEGSSVRLDASGKTGKRQLVPLNSRVLGYAKSLPVPGITYAVFYKEWRTAIRKLGIAATPHDLRHACASWMFELGADSFHVQDMLGHSSPLISRRYVHNKAATLAGFAERMATAHRLHTPKQTRKPQKRKTPAVAGA